MRHFSKILAERKQRLVEEIRRVLARSNNERYADLLTGTGDAGEVRDIDAAQARIAAGTYGTCIECARPIGKKRLEAYPTAKRCIVDQEGREKMRASAPHSKF